MTGPLRIRRKQLVRELAQVNRQIAQTQQTMARIEKRIVVLGQARRQAA